MPLGEKKLRRITGAGLVLLTLVTRLPFATKMLYEFDSIDFAVATFRYSLEQVTPHFPGYILHILFAKLLLLFTVDINFSFVLISVALSVGAVLYLWRAGAALRGERVGLIAASLWILLPIFWFYGLVATVYQYEAFFACALLYHGIKLIRFPQNEKHFFAVAILLSLATGARQSSVVFFAPAILFLALITKQRLRSLVLAFGWFVLTTACWLTILLLMCGGADEYLAAMRAEHIYKSQSFLFGNPITEHLAVMAKVIVYLIGGSLPIVLLAICTLLLYPKRLLSFVLRVCKSVTFQYCSLVALPPLVFYLAVYFMKAGYLLNVIPSIVLCGAVLIDQLSLWRAEAIKTKPANAKRFTRPLITRNAIIWSALVLVFNICWFTIRFPVTSDQEFFNAFTRDSFGELRSAITKTNGGIDYIFNRILSFTSIHSANESDLLHTIVNDTLRAEVQENKHVVILASWWHRWGYFYLPETTIYDIRDLPQSDELMLGVAEHYIRKNISEAEIIIPNNTEVILALREDHPAFQQLSQQVHLQRLMMPKYLDLWKITDSQFTLHWKDKVFVKR